MPRKKENKPSAYAWVAYMFTHQPEEMLRVLKHKTPSENLIEIAKHPVAMTTSEGKFKLVSFPFSLNTRRGQKVLYETVTKLNVWLKTIPAKAHELFQHVKTNLDVRRADTKRNILMVCEAVCHRAASEFKMEILFAFDSINTWIKAVYGKELGYHTIRKALETLHAQKFIKVNEWGMRGNRSKATKIELMQVNRTSVLKYSSEVDDWMMNCDQGMVAVYVREQTTRQDVLEAAIHHYADTVLFKSEDTLYVDDLLSRNSMEDLFFSGHGKMTKVETNTEEVNDDYFDRLLGELVSTVQKDVTFGGQTSSRIRRASGVSQNRGGSP